mmetsp:Transcript_4165/g.14522  ORF Transcript_4165/g.14522 Transcript_4165/m.14522 type:complete len:278 (+) Transcript_4165:2015-2848(+)
MELIHVVVEVRDEHLAVLDFFVRDTPEENRSPLDWPTHAEPRARVGRKPSLLHSFPLHRSQVQNPRIRERLSSILLVTALIPLKLFLDVSPKQVHQVAVNHELTTGPRRGPRLRRIADGSPRQLRKVELPQIVEVSHLAPGVVKAAKEERPVLVHHHAVARARRRTASQRDLLPRVCSEIEPPQVLVVVKFLLVWARKLAAKHPQMVAMKHRLVSTPWRRAVRAVHTLPHILIDVVPVELVVDANLSVAIRALAAKEDELRRPDKSGQRRTEPCERR